MNSTNFWKKILKEEERKTLNIIDEFYAVERERKHEKKTILQ